MAIANTTIQLKKSGVSGNVPSSLDHGELAINFYDGKLYYKNADNVITYISSGIPTNSFATINANSSLILASSNNDTLSFAAGNNITISACTSTKTITINAQDADVDQFARDTANSAQANSIYTQGVDETQNTQIAGVIQLAQAAYDEANTNTGGNSFGIIYTSNNNSYTNAATSTDQLNIIGEAGVYVGSNSFTKTIIIAGTPGAQGLTVDYGFVTDPINYSIDYGVI